MAAARYVLSIEFTDSKGASSGTPAFGGSTVFLDEGTTGDKAITVEGVTTGLNEAEVTTDMDTLETDFAGAAVIHVDTDGTIVFGGNGSGEQYEDCVPDRLTLSRRPSKAQKWTMVLKVP